jgi:hypothetical protein
VLEADSELNKAKTRFPDRLLAERRNGVKRFALNEMPEANFAEEELVKKMAY